MTISVPHAHHITAHPNCAWVLEQHPTTKKPHLGTIYIESQCTVCDAKFPGIICDEMVEDWRRLPNSCGVCYSDTVKTRMCSVPQTDEEWRLFNGKESPPPATSRLVAKGSTVGSQADLTQP